jgi:hypothetical protein
MESSLAQIKIVRKVIDTDLARCDEEQIAAFKKYAIEPCLAPIVRYGRPETAVVVARKGNEVVYWEDVEEGFNVSPVAEDGQILEHWCNQDDLGLALNAWIDGRGQPVRLRPAIPIE